MYFSRSQSLRYLFIVLSIIFILASLVVGYLFLYSGFSDLLIKKIMIYSAFLCFLILVSILLTRFFKNKKIDQQHRMQQPEGELARINSIIAKSEDAVFTCDLNGFITSWSHSASVMYGWRSDEIIGSRMTKLYQRFPSIEFLALAKKLQKGEKLGHLETEYLRKDGGSVWVHVSYSPIIGDQGEIIGVSVFTQDATESKKKNLILEQELRRFHIYVDTTMEWVWETDVHSIFVYSNNSSERILGISPENILGKSILQLSTAENKAEFQYYLTDIFENKKKKIKKIFAFNSLDGSIRYIEIHAEPIYDHKMNVVGILGNGLDVTEAKKLEKLKSEFISIVSHELRTPLTSIHAALGLLSVEQGATPKSKELIEVAFRSTKHLLLIINDILDLDTIEFGKFEIKIEPVLLYDIIHESIRLSKPLQEEYKIVFVEENMLKGVKVNADPQRLHQVATNILSNAAKFSYPGGKIYISMKVLGKCVRVSIRDEGEGIPESHHERIFGSFSRLDVSDARRTKGSGLGLIICKKIIEQLGGEIGFTSKIKEGSTFYFDLPQIQ